jgi:hypothetical protein
VTETVKPHMKTEYTKSAEVKMEIEKNKYEKHSSEGNEGIQRMKLFVLFWFPLDLNCLRFDLIQFIFSMNINTKLHLFKNL